MIKTILVLSDAVPQFEATLTSTIELARRFDAHIDVLHAQVEPLSLVPFGTDAVSASLIEEMRKAAEDTIEQRLASARAVYDRLLASADVSASWHVAIGEEAEVTAAAGRLRDLIVIGRPDDPEDGLWQEISHAALFESGRPVLLLPRVPRGFGERIAIAWNGSAQAARAVAGALPFLQRGRQITILSAGPVDPHASAVGLSTCLARHGLRAIPSEFESGYGSVGSALLDQCRQLGVDLLVMGAHGHSRFREMILGGTTQDVLTATDLPVLMAH